MRRVRLAGAGGLAASLCLFSAVAAQAATATPGSTPSAQQLNPAELAQSRAQQRSNDIFIAPEPGPCPLRDSTLTFTLKSVTFSDVTGLKPEALAGAYRGQVGQTIPVASICDIRDRAAAIMYQAGILARVEIPEQTIADGQLKLEVIEARVANIRFLGDAGPAQTKLEAYLEELRGMTPFNLEKAQRYLLLAADLPGVQISAAVKPSTQGRGAVDLEITAARDPIDYAANLQNFGSKALGPEAGLARVDFKGFTPWGDRTSLVAYSTLDGREQNIGQLIEELRPWTNGLILRGSASYAKTKPGGALAPLKLDGNAVDVELSANYPLIRRRDVNLNLIGGFSAVDQKTDFTGGGVLIDDKLRIVSARVQGVARRAVFNFPAEAELNLEVRKGLSSLGASQFGDIALSRAAGEPDALVGRLDGHATLAFTPWLQGYVGFQAQYANSPLLSFEQTAIGNLTIGRGYDPSSISGDRGYAVATEARLGPVQLPAGIRLSGYGFYDTANVEYVDTLERAKVHSTGAGIRLNAPYGVDIDLFYAKPLDKASVAAASKPPARVMVSITIRR
ncbi:MAG: ShlB/FhaC/HecB family hemolysin secretion/activation protein [Caulobacteraceae bacterium]|nr:ShlB/FhaC/HecB family hemolysin secretion/activation protein [Caulobacteraceae bacterium]